MSSRRAAIMRGKLCRAVLYCAMAGVVSVAR